MNDKHIIAESKNESKLNIEQRIANRLQSIFKAAGQIISDFYLENSPFIIGGLNAAWIAWDVFNLLRDEHANPMVTAVFTVGVLITIEGMAITLVAAAAKTRRKMLWFFSIIFAAIFTFAHARIMQGVEWTMIDYIQLASPYFVLVSYWARTLRVDFDESMSFERSKLHAELDVALTEKQLDKDIARKIKLAKNGLMINESGQIVPLSGQNTGQNGQNTGHFSGQNGQNTGQISPFVPNQDMNFVPMSPKNGASLSHATDIKMSQKVALQDRARQLHDQGYDKDHIAKTLNRSRKTINRYLQDHVSAAVNGRVKS